MKLADKHKEMAVGMVFADNDPRGPRRLVRVVAFDTERVFYARCNAQGHPVNERTHSAKLASFFRGGNRGFALYARPAK